MSGITSAGQTMTAAATATDDSTCKHDADGDNVDHLDGPVEPS